MAGLIEELRERLTSKRARGIGVGALVVIVMILFEISAEEKTVSGVIVDTSRHTDCDDDGCDTDYRAVINTGAGRERFAISSSDYRRLDEDSSCTFTGRYYQIPFTSARNPFKIPRARHFRC